jgi:Trk K+ transport system NAD-binding subunit
MVTTVSSTTDPEAATGQRWVVALTRRLASARQVRAVQRKVRTEQLAGHVVVYGLSQVGRRAVDELLRLGQTVVAVERPDRYESAGATDPGIAVVRRDLRQRGSQQALALESARALILTADDDMGNLQIALAAARRYPSLRIVVRMFRMELGRHIRRELPNVLTMSNSRLAAPRFVGAALRDDWEQHVQVRDRELVLDPGAEQDGFTLPGSTVRVALRPVPERRQRTRRSPQWADAAGRVVRDLVADRRLHVVVALIALLVVASTLVFRLGTRLDWFSALYAAVTEIATTGLDPQIAGSSGPVKAYAIGLLFAAAALLAAVYALFTDSLVSVRLSSALGRVPRRMRGHVVVCGLGAVGLRIAERVLATGLPAAGVQLGEDPLLLSARRQGIAIVLGDARFPSTLREAQAHRARAVVLATRDDLTNLEAGLMVRREFPQARVVVRMYDQQLARQARELLPDGVVLSTADLAGPAFAAAALGPRVRGTVEHGDAMYVISEATVQAGTPADGTTVAALETEDRIRVLGIEHDRRVQWHPPPGADVLAGDTVIAVTAPGGLDDLLHASRGGSAVVPTADDGAALWASEAEYEPADIVPASGGAPGAGPRDEEPPTGDEPWLADQDLD